MALDANSLSFMNQPRNRIVKFARTPLYFTNVERILRKLTNLRSPESWVGLIPPKHIDYPKPSARSVEVNGIKYSLDISDLVGWYIYWGFSDAPRRKLYSLITKGSTVIDVGANLGEVALNAAKLVGTGGKVYAFEPFPANYKKLAANLELNSFANLFIFNKGLGNEPHKVAMVAEENNAGMNRIASGAELGKTDALVEIIKLDDFVREKGLSSVDLIKIDVEGYEMNVLKGGIETIKQFRPKLFVEVIDAHLKRQGSSALEVFQFFEELDYSLSLADTGRPVDSRRMPTEFQYDVVATPGRPVQSPS